MTMPLRSLRSVVANILVLVSVVCVGNTIAHGRGLADLETDYPTAPSIQIDPAMITDDDLIQIRAAGFEFVRFGARPPRRDVNPALVDYSAVLRRVRTAGLRAIVTVFGGRRIWGDGDDSAVSVGNDARFAEFALDFMKFHAVDVAVWEIWNEPDIDTFLDKREYRTFASVISTMCTALSAMYPAPSILVGFGFASMPLISDEVPRALEDIGVSAARSGCLTDFSVHPYRRVPETAVSSYRDLQRRLNRLKLTTGVAFSEWGYATYLPVRGTREQASLLLREFLVTVASGIRLLNIYAWRDRGTSPYKKEDNFGIVSHSGQPKDAYFALSKLLRVLKNTRKVSFTQRYGVNELGLESDAALTRIIWTEGSEHMTRVAVSRADQCKRTSFMNEPGDASCGTPNGGFIIVKAGPEPVGYVINK